MARVRLHVPIDVEVSPELAAAGAAAVDLAKALVDADAIRKAVEVGATARRAWNRARARRR